MPAFTTDDLQSALLDTRSFSMSMDSEPTSSVYHSADSGLPLPSFESLSQGYCPPTLSIISPTPRALSFPPSAMTDSPYSSRGNSPVLRDEYTNYNHPYSLPQTPFYGSPISAGSDFQTLSPDSANSYRSLSPTPATHRRTRSLARNTSLSRTTRGDRDDLPGSSPLRPRKGDPDYIKRPENAFILFRRKCCEDRQADYASVLTGNRSSSGIGASDSDDHDADSASAVKRPRQADLSKTISEQWKLLPASERAYWEDLAKQKKKEHEEKYPGYVYRPQRSKGNKLAHGEDSKPKRSVSSVGKQKGKSAVDDGEELMLSYHQQRLQAQTDAFARPASAPLPPYGNRSLTIEIPSLYGMGMDASAPRSPPDVQMISRNRSSRVDEASPLSSLRSISSFGNYSESQFSSDFSGSQSAFASPATSISDSLSPQQLSKLSLDGNMYSEVASRDTDPATLLDLMGWQLPVSEPTAAAADGLHSFHQLDLSRTSRNNSASSSDSWFGYDDNAGDNKYMSFDLMLSQSQDGLNGNNDWFQVNQLSSTESAHSSPASFGSSSSLSHDDFDLDAIPSTCLEGTTTAT